MIKKLIKSLRKSRKSRLIAVFTIIVLVLPFAINTLLNTIANQAKADTFFKFDEGYGTTSSVNDSNSAVSAGSITGAVWRNEDFCFDGKCLYFDGDGDFVSFSDDPDLDFTESDSFTITLWFRHSPISSGTQVLVAKSNASAGYKVYMESDGDITFATDDDTTWSPDDFATSTAATYDDNKWHHIAAVKSGTTSLTLYIDGVEVAKDLTIDGQNTLENTASFYIGIDGDGTNNDYAGFIDEVKVYRSAKTASEIKGDYIKNSTLGETSASFGIKDQSYLTNGLAGYWTFDELRASAGTATDYSGNGTTLYEDGLGRVSGKFKNATDLERGSSQYFFAADNPSLSITGSLSISAWIKPESVTASTLFNIASKFDGTNESYQLSQYEDEIRLYIGSASNYATTDAANLAVGTWYHITAVYDSENQNIKIYKDGNLVSSTVTGTIPSSISDNTSAFHVGAEDYNNTVKNFYDGIIDDLRVYNRVLNPPEPYNLYLWRPTPLHHWKFDENTGTSSTFDSTGNGNTGTLQGTMTSANWVPGKYGSALYFNGSTNYVSTTTQTDTFEALEYYTVSLWFKTDTTTGGKLWGMGTAATGASASYDNQLYMRDDGLLQFNWWDSSSHTLTSTSAYNDNNWHHAAITYQPSGIAMYVDGSLVDTDSTDTSGRTQYAHYWRIAYDTLSGEPNEPTSHYFKGSLDDIRLYTYVRSPGEIIEDMNGGHPAPGSPVGSALGHWKFDEGYGDTANNSGAVGSSLNGNLAGSGTTCPTTGACPTWTNSGKLGKALSFDGTDDHIDMGNNSSLNFTTENFTISGYAYIASADDILTDDQLFKRGDYEDAGYYAEFSKNGTSIDLKFVTNQSSAHQVIQTAGGFIPVGSWFHWAIIKNGSTGSIYINGREPTSYTTRDTLVNPATSTASFLVAYGNFGVGDERWPKIRLDDIRIYNSALTSDQMKVLLNEGQSVVMGSLGTNSSYEKQSASQEYCIFGDTTSCNAPVGEWKFDDNTGTSVIDTSGNNNLGTWQNATGGQWIPGKYGSAGKFVDTSTQFVTTGTGSTLQLQSQTLSAWIYLDSSVSNTTPIIFSRSDTIVSGGYEWAVRNATSTPILGFAYYDGAVRGWYTDPTNTVPTNQWVHIGGVWDQTAGTVTFYVNGNASSAVSTTTGTITHISGDTARIGYQPNNNYWRGYIDHVRVYNYARTPAQIAWDMNQGSPVAWYKFDECTGTTANNAAPTASGADAGYDATISIGGTGDYSAPGTCSGSSTDSWKAGATGKYGSSIAFDGADDYAYLTSDINVQGWTALTVSAWIYPISGSGSVIISKADADNGGYGNSAFSITYNWSDQLTFSLAPNNDYNTNTITYEEALTYNTKWYHVVGTWDGSTMRFYVNGLLVGTQSTAGSGYINNCQTLYMGRHSTGSALDYYNGLLDDVRIYKYALNPIQIKTLYNENSAVRFQ